MFVLNTRPATFDRTRDRSFERFVNAAFGPSFGQLQQRLQSTDTGWTLQLDLPGVSREQLTIAIEDTELRIQSIDGAPRAYKLAFELPQALNASACTAKLEHGVLTLTLVRAVPENKAQTLTIE